MTGLPSINAFLPSAKGIRSSLDETKALLVEKSILPPLLVDAPDEYAVAI